MPKLTSKKLKVKKLIKRGVNASGERQYKTTTKQSNNILDTSMKECLVVNYHRSMMLKLKNLLDKNVLGKLTYWSGREKVQDNINLKCYQSIPAFSIFS